MRCLSCIANEVAANRPSNTGVGMNWPLLQAIRGFPTTNRPLWCLLGSSFGGAGRKASVAYPAKSAPKARCQCNLQLMELSDDLWDQASGFLTF